MPGIDFPVWVWVTSLCPLPSMTYLNLFLGVSRAFKPLSMRTSEAKWFGMIQATALPSFCGSLQTFTEALRIFLRLRGSLSVGSSAGLVSWY